MKKIFLTLTLLSFSFHLFAQVESGAHWIRQFPTSKSISDLASPFKEDVQAFVEALREAGAIITIDATVRPPNRAFIMHYCWRIYKGQIDPQDVPINPNINIVWAHKDAKGNYLKDESLKAARDMVFAYGMQNLQVAPALNSRHIQGLAIDMHVAWGNWPDNTTKSIRNKAGQMVEINKHVSTGTNIYDNPDMNPQLIEVGRSYKVIRYRNPEADPDHWSMDGN